LVSIPEDTELEAPDSSDEIRVAEVHTNLVWSTPLKRYDVLVKDIYVTPRHLRAKALGILKVSVFTTHRKLEVPGNRQRTHLTWRPFFPINLGTFAYCLTTSSVCWWGCALSETWSSLDFNEDWGVGYNHEWQASCWWLTEYRENGLLRMH
jgi:hypothetical protein